MAFYNPPYPETTSAYGAIDASLSMGATHLSIFLMGFLLTVYAIYKLAKYGNSISKNIHFLLISFGFIATLEFSDLVEHFDLVPGVEFWHHLHLLSGIAALYFIHQFAVRMDSDKAEPLPQLAIFGASLPLLLSLVISPVEEALEETAEAAVPFVIIAFYSMLFIIMAYFTMLILTIKTKAKDFEARVSTKMFVFSMLPLISIALFFFTLHNITLEVTKDIFVDSMDASSAFWAVFVILRNPLNMIIATLVMSFSFASGKIYEMHSVVQRFVGSIPKSPKSPVR